MSPEALVAELFGLSPERVNEQSSNQTLAEWDSLGHITLILELETRYGVSLSAEEALALTSITAIKEALTERGITW